MIFLSFSVLFYDITVVRAFRGLGFSCVQRVGFV